MWHMNKTKNKLTTFYCCSTKVEAGNEMIIKIVEIEARSFFFFLKYIECFANNFNSIWNTRAKNVSPGSLYSVLSLLHTPYRTNTHINIDSN